MSNNIWSRLEVRSVDYLADEKLRALMDAEGELDDYEGIHELTNPYTSYGEMKEIEKYCVENEIAFDRHCEADLETPARYRIYRPGDAAVDEDVYVDTEWHPYILCEDIFSILRNGDMADKEKLNKAMLLAEKSNFPCPLMIDYRSRREL